MSGCVVALLVVGGVVVLCALVAGFFAYRFVSSPDGQKVVSAVTSGAALVAESSNAPGTKELRALGCDNAMVIDAAKMQAIAQTFGDAGRVTADARLEIACQVSRGSSGPTCDQVAGAYVAAVGGQAVAPFEVVVGANGGKPECTVRYAEDGKRLAGGHERR
jgi:hypothetical protein